MAGMMESCFARNSSNSERFAECVLEKNKKSEQIMGGLEFRMLFFAKRANYCLSEQRKSVPECSSEVQKGITEMVEGTKRGLERL